MLNWFMRFTKSITMESPHTFGWFHIVCCVAVIVATIFLMVKKTYDNDKFVRKFTLIVWIIMVVGELYKQLYFATSINGDVVSWGYNVYFFPFQLCASVLYVLPFIALLKDCSFRDALIHFVSFFAFFGGLICYIYPEQLFTESIIINIQAMFHHGMQIVLGILYFAKMRKNMNIKSYLYALVVFLAFIIIAIVMNELVYAVLSVQGIDTSFNMFYISRHYPCTLPILDSIWLNTPYIVFLLIYVLGFVAVCFVIYLIMQGIYKLTQKLNKSKV